MAKMYCVYVEDFKWLGMMKKWQAHYLAFHVWLILRIAGDKRCVTIQREED